MRKLLFILVFCLTGTAFAVSGYQIINHTIKASVDLGHQDNSSNDFDYQASCMAACDLLPPISIKKKHMCIMECYPPLPPLPLPMPNIEPIDPNSYPGRISLDDLIIQFK